MNAHPPGTVFSYPYLWAVEHRKGRTEAKNRTTCMLLRIAAETQSGLRFQKLYLLGITDSPLADQDAIEVPVSEKRRAGLTVGRPAFVVISEGNEDVFPGSFYYAPGEPVFGQFSENFLKSVLAGFKAIISDGRLKSISRR